MWGDDHLSVLPDDLLRRILHFAPVNEAASTSALSKRWRGLWCSSGAVNIEARVPERAYTFTAEEDVSFFSRRDAIVHGARLALEAAAAEGSPVTRLSLRVEAGAGHGGTVHEFLYRDKNRGRDDVLADLLSLPSARHVEQLRITSGDAGHLMPSSVHLESSPLSTDFQALSFLSLPSETLRVLDLTSCGGLEPSAGVAFPRLESLRLSLCNVRNEHLQAVIDAAPALATLRLESVVVLGKKTASPTNATAAQPLPLEEDLIIRIHCPAATALVLDRCRLTTGSSFWFGTAAVEIDAPRLRRFTYKGVVRKISLNSQATDLAHADLHIIRERVSRRREDARRDLVAFWRSARDFSNAKELKLRVSSLDHIAVVTAASRTKLLCSFRNLERLEIEGMHGRKGKTAAVAIANLLLCCPVLRDLRIYLSTVWSYFDRHYHPGACPVERKYRHDLDKSIHAFENRRSEPVGQDDDDGDTYDHLSDLPALSGRVFPCLQSSLRRVCFQFRLEKTHNNFGVKLIKFFAQNAMVLEEMQIDGGNGKMRDHINCNIERWLASSSNDRKTSFVVLPLERPNHNDF